MEARTRTLHVADRLLDAVERAGTPACVGIDPVLERLPAAVRSGGARAAAAEGARGGGGVGGEVGGGGGGGALDAMRSFTLGVLDAVADEVPAVKLQSACFERYGHAGVALLEEMIAAARERSLVVILDAKRGDVGVSAEHYAAAVFGPDPARPRAGAPHWVTINAYFGEDGIRPFLAGGGAFALVRTSNPGGDRIQTLPLEGGGTVADGVAGLIATLGRSEVGERGYSALGAVVGATKRRDAERLRALMPQQIFLVPGFGAQGGTADDVRPCFDADGRGAIVTASRSVIYAAGGPGAGWTGSVREAARSFADEVGRVAGLR